MTNQKGAPEALFYADALDRCAEVDFDHIFVPSAAVIRRLHAENQRLATLVDAQQPAPSAAATVGEAPLPLLVRDIAADLGTTPIQVCTALATLGFGGHSVNMAVTPRMAQSLRAHFASPTPQADSQPATEYVGNGMFKGETIQKAAEHWANWCDVRCMTGLSEFLRVVAARSPADSVTAPAGGAGWKLMPLTPTREIVGAMRSFLKWGWSDSENGRRPMSMLYAELLAAAPTPPAQAADSVLENAMGLVNDIDTHMRSEWSAGRLPAVCWPLAFSDRIKALRAARKQGANHD